MAAHPLTRPASWTLAVGAPPSPHIRWAGCALWLGSAAVGLLWLAALAEDVLIGYVSPIYFLLAMAGALMWLALARRVWLRWFKETGVLTLQWRGPVVAEHRGARPQGGFHVAEWHAPVRVRVALSWQGWTLLTLIRVDENPAPAPAYAWLDARELGGAPASSRNRSLHQLRTLLHLPPSMTTQEGDSGPGLDATSGRTRRPMASWGDSYSPGSLVRRLVSLFRADRSPGASTPGGLDSSFPATKVMDRRAHSRPARVRGGGQ